MDENRELTINQALDLIFTSEKSKQLSHLIERLSYLKLEKGGRAKIDNSEDIRTMINDA